MTLRIFVTLSDTKSITGTHDAEKNRFVITSITGGKEIVEALQAYLAEPRTHPLPPELQSITQVTASQENFSAESTPWLSCLRFASNSIEGLDTSKGVIALAVADYGDYEKFWERPFARLSIGYAPYLV
jgi:hypothetical protein